MRGSTQRWLQQAIPVLLILLTIAIPFRRILFSPQALLTGDSGLAAVSHLKSHYPLSIAGTWNERGLLGRPTVRHPWTPRRFLMLVTSAKVYTKLAYLLDTAFLALAAYAWLSLKRLDRCPAVCGAIALGLAGHSFTMLHAGHMTKFGMFPYVILSLLCFDAAFSGGALVLFALGGLCMAMALAEHPDVAIMCGMLAGTYGVFRFVSEGLRHRKASNWCRMALGGLLAVLTFLAVSMGSIRGQYQQQVKGVQQGASHDPKEKWEWATQWSLPPEDTLEFIAPCVFGVASGDPQTPYWGRQGRSAGWKETGQGFRNFRQEGQYMSGIVFVFALFGVLAILAGTQGMPARWRKARGELLFWASAGLVTYLLALGKWGPLYGALYRLPYMNTMRNPVKLLYPFEVCAIIVFAYGLQFFIDRVTDTTEGRSGGRDGQ